MNRHPAAIPSTEQDRDALRTFYQTSDSYLRGLTEREADAYCSEYLRMVRTFVPAPARLLDLGCGTGYAAYRLSASNFNVVGMDISAKFLEQAVSRTGPHLRYTVGDAMELPFDDGVFDGVTSFDVIEHVVDVEGALREVGRVLRPGGRIVILCPNYWSPVIPLKALLSLIRGKDGYLSFYESMPAALRGLWTTTWTTLGKMRSSEAGFIYRQPQLEGRLDADCDCTYLPSPVDFRRFFQRAGYRIVRYNREGSTRFRRACSTLAPSFVPTVYIVAEKPHGDTITI